MIPYQIKYCLNLEHLQLQISFPSIYPMRQVSSLWDRRIQVSTQEHTFCSPKKMGTRAPGYSDPWGKWPLCQRRIAARLPRNKLYQSSYQSAPNSPSPEKQREKTDEGGHSCIYTNMRTCTHSYRSNVILLLSGFSDEVAGIHTFFYLWCCFSQALVEVCRTAYIKFIH